MAGNVSVILLYEPASAKGRPVPIARIANRELAMEAAKSAIAEAQGRAERLQAADEFLGKAEHLEVTRLQKVLALLIPGLQPV